MTALRRYHGDADGPLAVLPMPGAHAEPDSVRDAYDVLETARAAARPYVPAPRRVRRTEARS